MSPSFLLQIRSLAFAASLGFAISPLCGWAQDQPQNPQAPQALKPAHAAIAAEAPFLAENNTAMDKMMAGMEVKPTGDVDVDFAAMMIPHHQGAIAMALAELRYGRNERLRRIAQEIVVEQQQEIVAMHLALGQPLPTETASPTRVAPVPIAGTHDHASMSNGDMTMPQPNPTK